MNFVSVLGVLLALLVAVSARDVRFRRAVVGNKWPTNNISYQFHQNLSNETAREKIRSVLVEMEKLLEVDGQKCIEFKETDQHQDEGYIIFESKMDECSADIGYMGKDAHLLYLADKCIAPQVIMHEVLHKLGFAHEQSRFDRDQYVDIHHDNIGAAYADQYLPDDNSNEKMSQHVPYDFFSISHYPSSMFARDTAESAIESKFPSLMNQKQIDLAETLSPLDILQIQRFYKCRETPAPTIRGSVKIRADKQWKVGFKFLSEAAATKEFKMSVAEQYLERTLETCGNSHFWPLKYPLIENYDEHYTRVCVEKRALGESCQFSIECESGDCHEEKCSLKSHLEAVRLDNYYAGPLSVASPVKCYVECLMNGPCVAASFHISNQSCYLYKRGEFTAHRDPEYVSMELTNDVLIDKVAVVLKDTRLLNPYSNFTNAASPFQCFQACLKDTLCMASSFSSSSGNRCLLFSNQEHQMHKDSTFVTYMAI